MNYLLRVEAVNLGHFVYDTNKIQPTRGGSFLLLDSVQKLDGETILGAKLKKITTGASIGLYRFTAENGVKPEDVADEALKVLNTATGDHATFAVAYVKDTGNFKVDLLKLQTKVRWQQYQQPTLILPKTIPPTKEECSFDGVRPAVDQFLKKSASKSVKHRADKGRKLRQQIYKNILGTETYAKVINNIKSKDTGGKDDRDIVTDDIQELAYHKDMGNLNNKIAFIYLDGNKFTKIRNNLCEKSEELTAFSKEVEESRIKFLAALLTKAEKDKTFKTEDEIIRLETLLWGGDELEIIVPAWKGWEVLHDFFDAMKNVNFIKEATGEKAPLTHAGGIVFCNCKAPIREIRRMAHELSDMAKEAIKPAFETIESIKTQVSHEKHDTFHFLALESFDTVGGKIKPFAQNYFGKTIWDNMRLNADDMAKLNTAIDTMKKNGFPRNKIFDIVREVKKRVEAREAIRSNGQDTSLLKKEQTEQMHAYLEKVLDGVENKDVIINKIANFIGYNIEEDKIKGDKITGGEIERWFVISELWDYVATGGKA
jgi:hypothetical protein